MMSIKMKAGLGAFLAIAAFTGLAMPSKQEIARALTEVNRAMEPKRDEHVKGKIEAAAVADYALTLVGECGTEAEKFLLYREAVNFYAMASSYQKAVKATEELLGAIKDVPEETVLAMLKDALVKSRKEGGELAAYYESRCEKYQRARNVEKALKAYKKDPANVALQTKYAEALALAGNWKDALAEFAKAGGPIGEQAKKEIKGLGGPGASWKEAGDFWWSYYVVGESRTKINEMKIHAAELYQQAIDTEEVTGLTVRNLTAHIDKANLAKLGDTKAGGYDWYVPRSQKKPKTIAFKMADGHTIEFLSVPAGTFKMSNCPKKDPKTGKFDDGGFHMVTLRKPFWMSKYNVTLEDWKEFEPRAYETVPPSAKPFLNDPAYKLYRITYDCLIRAFTRFLTEKYASVLPHGYVFRLPTEAEFERAVMLGSNFEYMQNRNFSSLGFSGTSASPMVNESHHTRVSMKDIKQRTTVWGFSDIYTHAPMKLLDSMGESTFAALGPFKEKLDKNGGVSHEILLRYLNYAKSEIDPFRTARPDEKSYPLIRQTFAERKLSDNWGLFRLVIGPDVEKAAREAKK